MYNITFINTSNNIYEVVTGINSASNDLLSYMILVLVFLISFIAMKHFDTKAVFLASSMLTSLVGLFLMIAGWLSFGILIIPLVMLMFSIIIVVFSKK